MNLTAQAGPAASLGSRYVCVDPDTMKRLVKKVSASPDTSAAYMRALLEAFAPMTSVLGAMSLQNAADFCSVPPSYVKEVQTALENATVEETAQALVRAGAAESDIASGMIATVAAAVVADAGSDSKKAWNLAASAGALLGKHYAIRTAPTDAQLDGMPAGVAAALKAADYSSPPSMARLRAAPAALYR